MILSQEVHDKFKNSLKNTMTGAKSSLTFAKNKVYGDNERILSPITPTLKEKVKTLVSQKYIHPQPTA